MSEAMVLDITREAIYNILMCSLPPLLISLVIGLVISIFQTVTSIQEQTLTFVPKMVGIMAAIMIFGNFIVNNIVTYMTDLWSNFSLYVS